MLKGASAVLLGIISGSGSDRYFDNQGQKHSFFEDTNVRLWGDIQP